MKNWYIFAFCTVISVGKCEALHQGGALSDGNEYNFFACSFFAI